VPIDVWIGCGFGLRNGVFCIGILESGEGRVWVFEAEGLLLLLLLVDDDDVKAPPRRWLVATGLDKSWWEWL
jgi:hypothetical protein